MKSYSRDIGAYRRDTAELRVIEHGAYALLLDEYYATGRPLPADKTALYRICRALDRYERTAVDTALAKFFQLTDAGYIQRRTERELSKHGKTAEASRANGAAGGRPGKAPGLFPGFSPPSYTEVLSYMRELQILNTEEEARKFIEYWQAREWIKNERTGEMVSNFKRHVVTWKHNMGLAGGSNGKRDTRGEAQVGSGPETGQQTYCAGCGRTRTWHNRAERHPEREPGFDGHGFVAETPQATA